MWYLVDIKIEAVTAYCDGGPTNAEIPIARRILASAGCDVDDPATDLQFWLGEAYNAILSAIDDPAVRAMADARISAILGGF